MWRHLRRMNAELNGMLLRNEGPKNGQPRWTVTLAALQSIAPQWFLDPEDIMAQLESLREDRIEDAGRINAHADRIVGMEMRLRRLEKASNGRMAA